MEIATKKTTRRFWRRTVATKPWWPWGIAPLAGLGVLFAIGALLIAPRIEADVRKQVSERIRAEGLPALQVRGDGQGVTIITPAEAEEERYLRALAATTRCDTWAGQLACPTSVDIRRVEAEAAPAILETRPHAFSAEKIDFGVRLTGEVPDLQEHDRILGVARQHFDDITNALVISNEATDANYGRAVDRSLQIASRLETGKASWSGTMLTVTGSANSGAISDIREQYAAMGEDSLQGGFDVRPLLDGQKCNVEFDQILSAATIRFQPGSAAIDAGSDALLGSLAELARSCPGRLLVEGHTDSQGDEEANHALSLARAVAVRDALASYGVAADRMSAEGFGESRPIADNATVTGRAKNRRIVITVNEMD